MTPQELKASILQLAIQGKLVEQRPEEGTGEELFQKIQAEKQNLIKAGKIKKGKPYPKISDEEIPFDIPDTWVMARLQDIVYNRGQEVPSETFCYIDIGSIDNKRQKLNAEDNIVEANKAPSRARKLVKLGDILYSTVRPYLHNMCIVDRDFSYTPIASTGFAAMTCFGGIYNKYLFYYLLSPIFDNYANDTENAKGVAYPAINDERLYRAVVAIPPFAEQKRIVEKIEELLPLIDRYEQAWSRLEDFNKRFPVDMQKSILQMAIQGKLVEQRPEEGTGDELFQQIQAEKQVLIKAGTIKKEKPLPEIAAEETPFDIPESWRWVRLGEIASINGGFAFKSTNYTTNGVRVIRISDFNELGFVDDKIVRHPYDESLCQYVLDEKNILLCMTGGTVGKSLFVTQVNETMVVNQRVATIKVETVLPEYVYQVILAPITQKVIQHSKNSTNDNISMDTIKDFLIPLPPLAEQKRIVAKLEEILPLCERLK